uniref:Alstrom syndrome protein 1 homolog n=1 Tax=Callorhinchus milii TaxID=7868 RepID=A0A4W3J1C9_CALMI
MNRPDFISHSRERVRRLELFAEERRLQSELQSERLWLFNPPLAHCSPPSRPLTGTVTPSTASTPQWPSTRPLTGAVTPRPASNPRLTPKWPNRNDKHTPHPTPTECCLLCVCFCWPQSPGSRSCLFVCCAVCGAARSCWTPVTLLFSHSENTIFWKKKITRKEMVLRSKRMYNQLSEVTRRREEEKRKAENRSNRLKAQLYKKKVTNRVLGRKVAWE